MGITPRQQRFVDEYLVDLNATAAYKRAGYKCRTDKVAQVESCRLLVKPSVATAIEAGRAAQQKRTELTQDEVIAKLRALGDFNGEGSNHSARVKAYELLGKHLRMFPDSQEVSGPRGEPMKVEDVTPPTQRIANRRAQLLGAFGVGTDLPGRNGDGKPLDSGPHQNGTVPKAT